MLATGYKQVTGIIALLCLICTETNVPSLIVSLQHLSHLQKSHFIPKVSQKILYRPLDNISLEPFDITSNLFL